MTMFGLQNDGENIKQLGKDYVEEVEKLGGFLYFTYKSEMNAFIAEAYAEMNQYEGKLKTLADAFSLLQSTDCWRVFTLKKQYVEDIKSIKDAKLQNILIEKLNSVLKRTNKNNNNSKIVNNYRQFIKCIDAIWYKALKTYNIKLGKICYDVFINKNDTAISGGYEIGRMIK